jgi:hypothetical protein
MFVGPGLGSRPYFSGPCRLLRPPSAQAQMKPNSTRLWIIELQVRTRRLATRACVRRSLAVPLLADRGARVLAVSLRRACCLHRSPHGRVRRACECCAGASPGRPAAVGRGHHQQPQQAQDRHQDGGGVVGWLTASCWPGSSDVSMLSARRGPASRSPTQAPRVGAVWACMASLVSNPPRA